LLFLSDQPLRTQSPLDLRVLWNYDTTIRKAV
jgi:hypothetical protein